MLSSPEAGETEEVVGSPSPPVLPCGPHGRDESRDVEQQWGIHTFGSSGHSVGYGEGRQGRKRQRNRAVCLPRVHVPISQSEQLRIKESSV